MKQILFFATILSTVLWAAFDITWWVDTNLYPAKGGVIFLIHVICLAISVTKDN